MARLAVFCQAEDGIRYLVRSRGLGDVYKRQSSDRSHEVNDSAPMSINELNNLFFIFIRF